MSLFLDVNDRLILTATLLVSLRCGLCSVLMFVHYLSALLSARYDLQLNLDIRIGSLAERCRICVMLALVDISSALERERIGFTRALDERLLISRSPLRTLCRGIAERVSYSALLSRFSIPSDSAAFQTRLFFAECF